MLLLIGIWDYMLVISQQISTNSNIPDSTEKDVLKDLKDKTILNRLLVIF